MSMTNRISREAAETEAILAPWRTAASARAEPSVPTRICLKMPGSITARSYPDRSTNGPRRGADDRDRAHGGRVPPPSSHCSTSTLSATARDRTPGFSMRISAARIPKDRESPAVVVTAGRAHPREVFRPWCSRRPESREARRMRGSANEHKVVTSSWRGHRGGSETEGLGARVRWRGGRACARIGT